MPVFRNIKCRPFFTTGVCFLFVFLLVTNLQAARQQDEKSLYNQARKFISEGKYEDAKKAYLALIQSKPNNPNYLFECGIAFLQSGIEKDKALGFFTDALRYSGQDTIPELIYYAAGSQQLAGNYNEAIAGFHLFKHHLSHTKAGKKLSEQTDKHITECRSALTLPHYDTVQLTNPGLPINSAFADYAAFPSPDESMIFFTSRRSENTGGLETNDNQFFEDIYLAARKEDGWEKGVRINTLPEFSGMQVLTEFHDASVYYNHSTSTLYLYKDKDIWKSTYKDGKWNEPGKVTSVNSKSKESSLFISADEKCILFSSDRKGGKGNLDVWMMTRKENGEYTSPVNLGIVNSAYDEDSPFLTADGKELYFSSRGHNSMGGYDIFRCRKQADGSWSPPENLGYPWNSPADDIFFNLSDDGSFAWLSSSRLNGFGYMDIYRAQLRCPQPYNAFLASMLPGCVAPATLADSTAHLVSEIAETADSVVAIIPEVNKVIAENKVTENTKVLKSNYRYERHFGYNKKDISDTDKDFRELISQIRSAIETEGKAVLSIEGSASRVPTRTFTSNEALARARAETGKALLFKALEKAGIDLSKVSISDVYGKVQGPAYKNDFLVNRDQYASFQYISIQLQH